MHQKHVAVVEFGEQVLGAAPERRDARPSSRAAKRLGSGKRRSGRRCSTRAIVAPSRTGARPRRTVSTSGSSGMEGCFPAFPALMARQGAFLYGRAGSRKQNRRTMSDRVSFGYESVPLQDKQALVDDVFSSVARRYDLMNDLMSGGMHRVWKSAMVTALNPPKRGRPGGSSMSPAAPATSHSASPSVPMVTPTSPSPTSTRRCSTSGRARARGAASRTSPSSGERRGASLRGCALRRLHDRVRHPERAADRSGARAKRSVCSSAAAVSSASNSRPSTRRCSIALYDAYSFSVIPRLGRAVTGDAESYRYLVESIRTFPNQERFADMIRKAGFQRVTYRNLSGGIAALHSGWKL